MSKVETRARIAGRPERVTDPGTRAWLLAMLDTMPETDELLKSIPWRPAEPVPVRSSHARPEDHPTARPAADIVRGE